MAGDELVVGPLRPQLGKIHSTIGDLAEPKLEIIASTATTDHAQKWEEGMRYGG